MDKIDRRDTMKDSQLEQSISQLDQHIRWIQTDSAGVSYQLSTINRRLDNLERSSAAAFYPLLCCHGFDKLHDHDIHQVLIGLIIISNFDMSFLRIFL